MLNFERSLKFNLKEDCWIAQVKKPDGKWKTKWLPKAIGRRQEIEAEAFLSRWYETEFGGAPQSLTGPIEPAKKTLATLAPKWLSLRYQDSHTKENTYRGFVLSVNNWILDNPKFPHASIQHIDLETQLTVADIREWIHSLAGAPSSKLQHASTLASLINDATGEGWLDENFTSPFLKSPIQKLLNGLRETRDEEHSVIALPIPAVNALLTKPCFGVMAWRRVRYTLAIATLMRDAEIQALTWGDVHGAIKVERQLEKIGVAPPIEYETEMKGRKDRDGILKTPRAVVSPPKKKSKRLIPMHPLLQAVLAWWKAKGWPAYVGRSPTDSDPVFPSPAGAYCFPDSSVGVRADLERLGQDSAELTFHALRRTGSTLLEEAGVSRDFVGILLGHGAKSTAGKHYLAQGEALREAVARMALPPWEAVRPALEESRLRNNVAANRSASLSSANGKRSNDQKQETQSGTA